MYEVRYHKNLGFQTARDMRAKLTNSSMHLDKLTLNLSVQRLTYVYQASSTH